MKIIKKIITIFTILMINAAFFMGATYAKPVEKADLYTTGYCGELLKYKGVPVIVHYVEYNHEGITYPAYCVNKEKDGVTENYSYSVSVSEAINDVGLWRMVVNGYPYKSIQELGVANREEAFTATKQAIYCYLYENEPTDYEAIGEAGARTLNALHTIVNNARNSSETKVSSSMQITPIQNEWKQDEKDKKFVSKTFHVTANSNIRNYKISLTEQKIDGIKITNLENKETNEFTPNEDFKVLIPIKNMRESGAFKLSITGDVKTKPILYGVSPDSNYQNYALSTEEYEIGTGEKTDQYPENETKLIIIKEDNITKEKIENTEFELLDENRNVVYSDLRTNSEGKIEINHLMPGRYYLKETKAKEGYEKPEDLIELQLEMQEKYTVTVKNNREDTPSIEITKNENSKSVNSSSVKRTKLPVTGM